jgi:hypothetical protein
LIFGILLQSNGRKNGMTLVTTKKSLTIHFNKYLVGFIFLVILSP